MNVYTISTGDGIYAALERHWRAAVEKIECEPCVLSPYDPALAWPFEVEPPCREQRMDWAKIAVARQHGPCWVMDVDCLPVQPFPTFTAHGNRIGAYPHEPITSRLNVGMMFLEVSAPDVFIQAYHRDRLLSPRIPCLFEFLAAECATPLPAACHWACVWGTPPSQPTAWHFAFVRDRAVALMDSGMSADAASRFLSHRSIPSQS